MDLRDAIQTEFERRQARNHRYSLRAYARSLGTHHGTLAQLLRRERRLTTRTAAQLCRRLGLSTDVGVASCLRDDAERVLRLLASPGARVDSRWLATRVGVPLDDVNRALQLLLHERRLVIPALHMWSCHPDSSPR